MVEDVEIVKGYLRQERMDIDRAKEILQERNDNLKAVESLLNKAQKYESMLEQVKAERDDLKAEVKALQMQLDEQQKMAKNMAAKTEDESLVKALRTYMNHSKKKTAKKRGYIKMMVTELALSVGLTLPEDMVETLEAFDDDEDVKMVNNFYNTVNNGTLNGDVLKTNDGYGRNN